MIHCAHLNHTSRIAPRNFRERHSVAELLLFLHQKWGDDWPCTPFKMDAFRSGSALKKPMEKYHSS